MRRTPYSGFTLVELAIVLTIIALILGGILGGVALSKAAGTRSIGADLQRFQQATHQFYDKYNGLPGDLANATSYWGNAYPSGTGSDVNCQTAIVTSGTATCNGNGNGNVDTAMEYYRFWQQLANAGLIPGFYTGAPASPAGTYYYNDVIGTNIPASKVKGVGYSTWPWAGFGPNALTPVITPNWIDVAPCCSPNGYIEGRAFKAEDVWDIDTKFDDGYPYFGRLQVYSAYWSGCTTTNAVGASYAVSTTTPQCGPFDYNLGL